MLRPVVGDDPGREVVLRRPTRKRPRMAEQLLKLLGDGGDRFGDRPGHVGSIALAGGKQNGPCLRHGTPGLTPVAALLIIPLSGPFSATPPSRGTPSRPG